MTKYETIRNAEMARHANNINDDGRNGRKFELECARANSRKIKVAEQNEIDVYVKFISENGKPYYVPCECKTNGGRVDELLNGSKAQYVIYRLDTTQKHKASKKHAEYIEVRKVEPVIIPKALFLAKLVEFNAIKAINRNGELDGYGIQVSSKKWFEWLSEYPVKFDNESAYEVWEFEGLE